MVARAKVKAHSREGVVPLADAVGAGCDASGDGLIHRPDKHLPEQGCPQGTPRLDAVLYEIVDLGECGVPL